MGLRSLSFYGKLVTLFTSDTASQLRATSESRDATGESGGLDATFNGLGVWDDRPRALPTIIEPPLVRIVSSLRVVLTTAEP